MENELRTTPAAYLLFGGDFYHPDGGVKDLIDHGAIDDLDELVEFANTVTIEYQGKLQWWHIADRASMKIVREGLPGRYS